MVDELNDLSYGCEQFPRLNGKRDVSASSSSELEPKKRSTKLCFRICSLVSFFHLIIVLTISLSSLTNVINAHYCQTCNPTRPEALNVHIVCHTHLDTGWTSTYQYYYYYYVRGIYYSVIESLLQNETRKFIAVESSFFTKWYNEANETIKQAVQNLVATSQLEFIGGGWSMNDEAAAHYSSIIDNLSYGHKRLEEIFGKCGIARTGWQIDPFGHSAQQASLFAQMGFDSLFLGRIDYQDKTERERTRTLEFVWKPSPNLGQKGDIFTGILPNVYWPPDTFCWDRNCWDPELTPGNIQSRSEDFINLVKKQSRSYSTRHTVITMGMDFYYRNASKWYRNLDYLMQSVNAMTDKNVYILYSTPGCYAKALSESNLRWTTESEDFFPYADRFNDFWTGYFTSRPSLKYAIKIGHNLLHATSQLNVLAMKGYEHAKGFEDLKGIMGILQHHDAVTGTSTQRVAEDYLDMFGQAAAKAQEAIVSAYTALTRTESIFGKSKLGFCDKINSSTCPYTESIQGNNSIVMSIYNPIAHPLKHFVRIPVVNNTLYKVIDHKQRMVPSQLVPIFELVETLPEKNNSPSTHELVFFTTLDPLGISSYLITSAKTKDQGVSKESHVGPLNEDILLHNGKIGILIDSTSGLLKEIQLKGGEAIPFKQALWYYKATPDNTGEKPSGAYAFNPTTDTPFSLSANVTYKIYRGDLVDEIHQVFTPWCGQVIKLYKNYSYIEFDWVVGPIPTMYPEETGLEIISRYETNFQNKKTFFTDSNGRESIKRVRDFRPTWQVNTTEKVASNYYPVTSWIYIRDTNKDLQMTILPDRAEGGSSMVDGAIELMLHRRLLYDDGYGVEEALNEPGVDGTGLKVRGKHRLIIGRIKESVHSIRRLSKTTAWFPIYMFSNVSNTDGLKLVPKLCHIGIRKKLPVNVHLLQLEQWSNDYISIRLEHVYEIDDDRKYSKNAEVNLSDLFSSFIIEDVKEMVLTSVDELQKSEKSKLKFTGDRDRPSELAESSDSDEKFKIILKPMEIRTFWLRFKSRF